MNKLGRELQKKKNQKDAEYVEEENAFAEIVPPQATLPEMPASQLILQNPNLDLENVKQNSDWFAARLLVIAKQMEEERMLKEAATVYKILLEWRERNPLVDTQSKTIKIKWT